MSTFSAVKYSCSSMLEIFYKENTHIEVYFCYNSGEYIYTLKMYSMKTCNFQKCNKNIFIIKTSTGMTNKKSSLYFMS